MNKSRRKLKGFTLLELMVVVAIIAVMAGILVPSVMDYIRTSNIKSANTQAQQIYMAAQDYLVNEQIRGVKSTDITDGTPQLCWIMVTTKVGSSSTQYDKTNTTEVKDSYGIKKSTGTTGSQNMGYVSKTMADGTISYPIADGIESRLEPGFEGTWVVAFYPKTFTVAYAVCNTYYKTSAEREDAVALIGTNNKAYSASSCWGRLYENDFYVSAASKKTQEKDFKNPDSSEKAHMYTGQFPIRDFKADPII